MSDTSGGITTATPRLEVREISMEAPWTWLAAGWRDVWTVPHISLLYGAVFALVSAALTLSLLLLGIEYLLFPLIAGFMLVGPMLAVGLYETSRCLAAGETPELKRVFFVATRSPTQLAFLGVLLSFALLAWMQSALLLFALFFGDLGFPPFDELVNALLFTERGLALIFVGSLIGGLFATAVFAVSAVSVPILMVHDIDAISAMMLSLRALQRNLKPLALWAWLIVLVIGAGLVPFYLGLVVTFPLVGHATWHAYSDLIVAAE